MTNTAVISLDGSEKRHFLYILLSAVLFMLLCLFCSFQYVKFDLPHDESVNIPLTASAERVAGFSREDRTFYAFATQEQFDAAISANQFMLYTDAVRYSSVYGIKYRWIDGTVPEGLGHRMFVLPASELITVDNVTSISWKPSIDLVSKTVSYSAHYSDRWNSYHFIFRVFASLFAIIVLLHFFALRLFMEGHKR